MLRHEREKPAEKNLIEQTARSLEQALMGKFLVQFDRFGQAMRNTYSLKDFDFLTPDLSLCHYDTWYPENNNSQVLSREKLEQQRTKKSGVGYDVPFEEQIGKYLSQDSRMPIFKVWFSTASRQKLAREHGGMILSE